MSENVIELNGKRYDAVTGAYLGKSQTHPIPAAPAAQPASARAIDGFIRPAHRQPHPKAVAKPSLSSPTVQAKAHPSKVTLPAKPATAPYAHTPAPHARAHKPERTKTLMRTTVKKPAAALKPVIKPQAPAEVAARPASSLMRKASVSRVDPTRMEHAQLVPKHHAVAHFHSSARGDNVHAAHHQTAVPVIAVKPVPTHHIAHHEQKPDDLFEAAVSRATSHQEPKHKYRRQNRRMASTLAAITAFVVLGGFIAYLNMPNIELHVASAQAGFHATMPSYAPTGYALQGGIKHAGGTVSIRFSSGDSSYTITQQASNWNSQALLDNTLALSGAHKTVQKNGQTIYIYADGAAWVNNGVRYDMSSRATLSTDEIVSIAASL
ncbi:MAG TPA: hypothetical protein VLI54_05350 [Bacillota bacterium]|nr:hypothetical protein [Bacillota bacterium]